MYYQYRLEFLVLFYFCPKCRVMIFVAQSRGVEVHDTRIPVVKHAGRVPGLCVDVKRSACDVRGSRGSPSILHLQGFDFHGGFCHWVLGLFVASLL